jgi:glutamate-ammonia-ligase adenylyltransferase
VKPPSLEETLRAAGLADEAIDARVRAWLRAAPAAEVREGIAAAADPGAALIGLARLLEAAEQPPAAGRVADLLRLLGGSQAISAALAAEGAGWPALLATVDVAGRTVAEHRAALGVPSPLQAALRAYRRRQLVRVGGRDLLGRATVADTVRELSALAEGLIAAALEATQARLAADVGPPPSAGFVVLGMGKLGGGELNYSSDVDLVYVYERDAEHDGRTSREWYVRLAEELTRALGEVTAEGRCMRVDLRLRPGGGEGPLAVSLAAALSYYETWGETWERAVWLKARPIAGDLALGERLAEELDPFIHRRYLDFGTLEDLHVMKQKVDASLRGPAARARDVKLGWGGIREVEFFVQAQQLIHVGKDARLADRSTLGALARLAEHGYVEPARAAALADAYRFLRDVEHKIQIVHERQTHQIPDDPAELTALARRLGLADVAAFRALHGRHTGVVHEAFEALFAGAAETRRREQDADTTALLDQIGDPEGAVIHLARLGFADAEAAYRDLRLLRDGPPHAPASARRRQALATLAPSLLAEIARSPAPDRALHHLATFISTVGARTSYLHLLLENPGVLRLLVRLFAASEFLSQFFLRHPELLDSLVRADLVQVERSLDAMAAELDTRLAAAPDLESALDTLRRFRHEEFLRIGVHDIQGELALEGVERQLSHLAETSLRAALAIARREVLARTGVPDEPPTHDLAVLGMGKLGGEELSYNSDLDLIFVYEVGDPAWWDGRLAPHEFFTRIAQRTISALQTPTREGIAYRIDTRLRPSGNQGSLVTSREAFEGYHRTSAEVWERQALIKARPVAGPQALRGRLEAVVDRFVYSTGLSDAERDEIARIRERIERERAAAGGLASFKTGRGGLIDVEFLVQMLQLRHGHERARLRVRTTRAALAALEGEGLLPLEEVRALADGYAFLRVLESRLRLDRDQPVEAMDEDRAALVPLARRLGYSGSEAEAVAGLEADHARHRAAIRAIYDRRVGAGGD